MNFFDGKSANRLEMCQRQEILTVAVLSTVRFIYMVDKAEEKCFSMTFIVQGSSNKSGKSILRFGKKLYLKE